MAILMMGGIAAWWSFGREFVDGDALPALLGIATPRSSVAVAEFVVLAGWALLTVVSTVILTSDRRPAPRTDMDAAAVQAAPRVTVAGLLGARGVGRIDGAGLQLVPRFTCQDSSPCWPWWS